MAQEVTESEMILGRLGILEAQVRILRRRLAVFVSLTCVMIAGSAAMLLFRKHIPVEGKELRLCDEQGTGRASIEIRSDQSVALVLTDAHGVTCASLSVTANVEPKLELNEGAGVAHVVLGVHPPYRVTSGIAGRPSGGFMSSEEAYIRLYCGNGEPNAGMDVTTRGFGEFWVGGLDQTSLRLSPQRLAIWTASTCRARLDTVGLKHTVLQLVDDQGKTTWTAP